MSENLRVEPIHHSAIKAAESQHYDHPFISLFESVLPDLHRYVARQCPPDDVDDVCADIFAEVYLRWPWAPDSLESQRMWVFGFARNKLHELNRAKRYRVSLSDRLANHSLTSKYTEFEPIVTANDRVKRLLVQIPDKEREVILLTVFAGFNSAETAQILGTTVTAVTTRASRARKHLKRLIENEGIAR